MPPRRRIENIVLNVTSGSHFYSFIRKHQNICLFLKQTLSSDKQNVRKYDGIIKNHFFFSLVILLREIFNNLAYVSVAFNIF